LKRQLRWEKERSIFKFTTARKARGFKLRRKNAKIRGALKQGRETTTTERRRSRNFFNQKQGRRESGGKLPRKGAKEKKGIWED